jgi:gamma-tubulin complex component 5
MAYQGDHSALDELIQETTGLSKQHAASDVNRVHRRATSVLKDSRTTRVNQFAVFDRFEGLEEKARVFSYPELADALRDAWIRLGELENKWTPEVLSFLLNLSDDPINKTSVEDLATLARPADSALTWDDLLKDDPPNEEDGIWETVNYAEGSSSEGSELGSDDEIASARAGSLVSEDTPLQEDYSELLEAARVTTDLPAVTDSHTAIGSGVESTDEQKLALSETRIIRETIFMLLGLPSDIYDQNSYGGYSLDSKVGMNGVSREALVAMLDELAMVGSKANYVREWARGSEHIQLVQAFQAALTEEVRLVDNELACLQKLIIEPMRKPTTLLSLRIDVRAVFRTLLPLHDILRSCQVENANRPFAVLERLFDQISQYQARGELDLCRRVTTIFLQVFRSYTKPLKKWMTSGEVDREGVFFVQENKNSVPLAKLWPDKFFIARDNHGQVEAPSFLHLSIQRIFTNGKSVRFLKALSIDFDEPTAPDFELHTSQLLPENDLLCILPLNEAFTTAFDGWLSSLHQASSRHLRDVLYTRHGLRKSLVALEHIYFGKNGSATDAALSSLFEAVDVQYPGWDNGVILTGNFRDAFGAIPHVEAHQLTVRAFDTAKLGELVPRSIHVYEALELVVAQPWMLANVIRAESMHVYQRVFVLSTQIQRAKRQLDKQTLRVGRGAGAGHFTHDTLLPFLRHRLRWYVDTLQTYFATMLPLSSAAMYREMDATRDVDEMIAAHSTFMQQIELRSLARSQHSSVRQAVVSLLDLAVVFSGLSSTSSSAQEVPGAAQVMGATETMKATKMRQMVDTFNRLLSFVLAGVTGASRTEGDEFLQMLADDLAFGLKPVEDLT